MLPIYNQHLICYILIPLNVLFDQITAKTYMKIRKQHVKVLHAP